METKRKPAQTIPGNPLARAVQERLKIFRDQALTTIRTVRDVATLMEIQPSTLNTYLNGRRRATPEFCDRLAVVLGLETLQIIEAADATWAMREEPAGLEPRHKYRVQASPLQRIVTAKLKEARIMCAPGPRTVSDVAKVMGTTLGTLNTYLDGRRRLSENGVSARRIAEAVGIPLESVENAAAETQAIIDEMKNRAVTQK